MKVRVTLEFSREDRLAVAHEIGETSPASRRCLEVFVLKCIDATLEDLRSDLDRDRQTQEDKQ